MRRTTLCLVAIAALALFWSAHGAPAQGADAVAADPVTQKDDSEARADMPDSLWGIITSGGPIGIVIILLSVAAVALVIEHVMTIREQVLIPPGLGEEVRTLLSEGKLAPAQQRCRAEPSFLSYVLEAGILEVGGGWPAIEKAVEDATADQSARLFRKIEYLSVIGAIAPMLGLLGTVMGMIFAFREVSGTQGAVPPGELAPKLAGGIYLALVTTVEGLIVAIPSLAAFAIFRNRVDQLVAEVTYVAQHVFNPLKRRRPAGRSSKAATPEPPPVGEH